MKKLFLLTLVTVFLGVGFWGGMWFRENRVSDLEALGFILYPLTVDKSDGGTIEFKVAIADEPKERTQGLQIAQHLNPHEGMWFVFEGEALRRFWMKDMTLALDMLFVSQAFQITTLVENAPPCFEEDPTRQNCSIYSSLEPVKYVLEVAAGSVAKYDLMIGDTIIPPAL